MTRTTRQETGDFGENLIIKKFNKCPKCKNNRTLRKLPNSFKCADIIFDFCGYLAQIKTKNTKNLDNIPKEINGAAWKPQKERMDAGIYFPLYLVLKFDKKYSVYYLASDLQEEEMFVKRKPLSDNARRAGWTGFKIVLEDKVVSYKDRLVKLEEC